MHTLIPTKLGDVDLQVRVLACCESHFLPSIQAIFSTCTDGRAGWVDLVIFVTCATLQNPNHEPKRYVCWREQGSGHVHFIRPYSV